MPLTPVTYRDPLDPASDASAAAEAPTRRGRGRRPLAEVKADTLLAAGALLIADGYAGFTLEKVALHSGVSRVTLNRHWPSRGALALDGYLHQTGDRIEFRDTGSLVADLRAVLAGLAGLMDEPAQKRAFTQLIGAAQSDPELAAAFDSHYFGPRRDDAVALLSRGIERGELRSDLDLPAIVDMLWGACYQRLLLPNLTGTLTLDFIDSVIATLLRGIAAPPLQKDTTHG